MIQIGVGLENDVALLVRLEQRLVQDEEGGMTGCF